MAKVKVLVEATGRTQHVPEHFLSHPTLGKGLKWVERKPATDTPSEDWTLAQLRDYASDPDNGVDLAGARTKADVLSAIEASMGNNGSGNNANAGN